MKNHNIPLITLFAITFAALPNFSLAHIKGEKVSLDDTLEFLKRVSPNFVSAESNTSLLMSLSEIKVFDGKMTDEAFKFLVPLCHLPNIKNLDFRFNRLTGEGLKIIADACGTWESIGYIDLGGNPLSDEYLTSFNAFPNVTALNIDFHDENAESLVTGAFLRTLKLAKLKSIWATGTGITDENALILLEMPSVKKFNFRDVALSESVLERLSLAKINVPQSPWALRRMEYEYEEALPCIRSFDENQQSRFFNDALENEFVTEEAAAFAKQRDLVPLAFESYRGDYQFHGVCRDKKEIPVEVHNDEL